MPLIIAYDIMISKRDMYLRSVVAYRFLYWRSSFMQIVIIDTLTNGRYTNLFVRFLSFSKSKENNFLV